MPPLLRRPNTNQVLDHRLSSGSRLRLSLHSIAAATTFAKILTFRNRSTAIGHRIPVRRALCSGSFSCRTATERKAGGRVLLLMAFQRASVKTIDASRQCWGISKEDISSAFAGGGSLRMQSGLVSLEIRSIKFSRHFHWKKIAALTGIAVNVF